MTNLAFILAYVGLGIMLAGSGMGSAVGVVMSGNCTIAGLKKNPDMFGKAMILSALPATQGLYGFAGFFLMYNRIKAYTGAAAAGFTINMGGAVLAAGLGLGLVGYLSALRQAAICANGVNEISNGQDVFGKTMILAVFPELYAILSFAATFLALPPAV